MQSGQGTAEEREYLRRMQERKRPPVAPDPTNAIVLMQLNYRQLHNTPDGQLIGEWGIGMVRHNVSLVVHRAAILELVELQICANHGGLPGAKTNLQRKDSSGVAKGYGESGSRAMDEADEDDGGVDNEDNTENESSSDEGKKTPVVPWEKWSHHARWQADDTHVSHWITTSAGQRYVGVDEVGHIIVKDFNPLTVRRARAAQLQAEDDDGAEHSLPGSSADADSDVEAGSDSNWVMDEGTEEDAEVSEAESAAYVPAPSSFTHSDDSWESVRIIDGYSEIEELELQQLFSEDCKWPLPCVEYISKKRYPQFHGLLMDEERILGLTVSNISRVILNLS